MTQIYTFSKKIQHRLHISRVTAFLGCTTLLCFIISLLFLLILAFINGTMELNSLAYILFLALCAGISFGHLGGAIYLIRR